MPRMTLVVPRVIEPESALLGVCSIASYVNRPDLIRIAIAGRDNYRWDDFEPDYVGFAGWTVEMNLVKSLAVATRNAGFKGRMLLGGHHITMLHEARQYLRNIFDVFIEGEAEEKVKDFVTLTGCCTPGAGPYSMYGLLEGEEIPIPDPAMYPKYRDLCPDSAGRPIAILTARGCINHCRFCATQAFGRRYRMMPVGRVMEMIDLMIRRYPERHHLVIWDDCFTNMPIARLTQLVDEYIKCGFNTRFASVAVHGGISWPIKEETWGQLKRMGVTNFNCGFESGSDRILKWLKNDDRVSVENIKKNCQRAKELGINCDGSFQFGVPGETPEDTKATLELMSWKLTASIPGGVWWFVTCPLPGTELWKMALESGRVKVDMDFGQLHLHRLQDPLMLDPSYPRHEWEQNLAQAKTLMSRINGRPYFQA